MGSYKFLLLLLVSLSGYSQTVNRYFVSFKDKSQTPFSISSPSQFLSAKSIARRAREKFQITTEDLPVDPNYVAQVKSAGASVFFTSRWFNGVLVQMDDTLVPSMDALSFVSKVELVAPGKKLSGGRKSKVNPSKRASETTTQYQLQMIGLDQMHSSGYLGEGVDVAVLDAGYIGVNTTSPFQHLFSEGRVIEVKNFVKNTSDVYSDYDHGTEVLSLMAAYEANVFEGGAYKANYYLYETEDVFSEYRVEEYNWAFAAERADSAGIEVINSSLGYNTFDDSSMDYTYADMNGKTTIAAQAARKAFERGILVVVAAGNEGGNAWKYITTPADAEGVIASGSVDYYGNWSLFSSSGPTADGRIKPEVCAFGSNPSIILYDGTVGTNSGTSLSSPLIASLVVGLRQAYPNVSAKEIYSVLINSGSQASSPDNNLGYGIPNFSKALRFLEITDEWVLYPNPTVNGEFKVFFKEPDDQSVTIKISNLTGEEIANMDLMVSLTNNPLRIKFAENVPPGVYVVSIQTPRGIGKLRVVKW